MPISTLANRPFVNNSNSSSSNDTSLPLNIAKWFVQRDSSVLQVLFSICRRHNAGHTRDRAMAHATRVVVCAVALRRFGSSTLLFVCFSSKILMNCYFLYCLAKSLDALGEDVWWFVWLSFCFVVIELLHLIFVSIVRHIAHYLPNGVQKVSNRATRL